MSVDTNELRTAANQLKSDAAKSLLGKAAAELETLRAARERLLGQLAACGTAALQDTEESRKQRIGPDNPYYSPAYGDVCRRVDECISLRAENNMLADTVVQLGGVGALPFEGQAANYAKKMDGVRDDLAKVRAEVTRLHIERDEWQQRAMMAAKAHGVVIVENARLKAQVEAARVSLDAIRFVPMSDGKCFMDGLGWSLLMSAKAALAPEPGTVKVEFVFDERSNATPGEWEACSIEPPPSLAPEAFTDLTCPRPCGVPDGTLCGPCVEHGGPVEPEPMKTWQEWDLEYRPDGMRIWDPDGFRIEGGDKPMTKNDFEHGRLRCTMMPVPKPKPEKCKTCGGTGKVSVPLDTPFSDSIPEGEKDCPGCVDCYDDGKCVHDEPKPNCGQKPEKCPTCGGTREVPQALGIGPDADPEYVKLMSGKRIPCPKCGGRKP